MSDARTRSGTNVLLSRPLRLQCSHMRVDLQCSLQNKMADASLTSAGVASASPGQQQRKLEPVVSCRHRITDTCMVSHTGVRLAARTVPLRGTRPDACNTAATATPSRHPAPADTTMLNKPLCLRHSRAEQQVTCTSCRCRSPRHLQRPRRPASTPMLPSLVVASQAWPPAKPCQFEASLAPCLTRSPASVASG